MGVLSHSTTAFRQSGFALKGAGTQDSCQHFPTSLPLHGTQLKKPLIQPSSAPTMAIAETDASSPNSPSFMSKKNSELKSDYANSFELGSLFMGPLVQLQEETLASKKEAAMAVLAVSVASAVELDERQADLIAQKMRRLTGFPNLRLEKSVDRTLIAGFVISYGDDGSHVIDLSVKGQLATLASRIESFDR